MNKLKISVMISGRGSNLRALIDACRDPDYPVEIGLVISNVMDAPGLIAATNEGIPTLVMPHKQYKDRQAFEVALDEAHRAMGSELICLAGFMRILSPYFVGKWEGRMINIHPSLLPAFPGLDTHARALAAGVRITGCTVHYVNAEVDGGAILVQAAVPIVAGDTEVTLSARILAQEHIAYPLAVRLIAEGRVAYVAGQVERAEDDSGLAENALLGF